MSEVRKSTAKRPYYHALDALRFLAIVGVVLYHYWPHLLPGGFLGVDLFLVLSGFLITESIWRQMQRRFKPIRYFIKRVVRLLMPLLWLFLWSLAFFTIFAPELLFNVRDAFTSSVLFYNNWAQIASGGSYFQDFANPSPYTHLWYLALQMQFYIIAPLLLVLLSLKFHSRRQLGSVFFFLSVISAVIMAVMFVPGSDPSRVYYGTDTRAFSFLLGGMLALWLPIVQRALDRVAYRSLISQGLLLLSLGLVIFSYLHMHDQATFTYRGGMFLFALLSTILIFTLTRTHDPLVRFLSLPIFSWLGKISFSAYLWYYPVYTYFTKGPLAKSWVGTHPWAQWLILLALAIVTYLGAEVVWTRKVLAFRPRRLEVSFKEYVQARFIHLLNNRRKLVAVIVMIAVFFTALVGFVQAPSGQNETVEALQARIAANEKRIAEEKAEAKRQELGNLPDIEGLSRNAMLYAYELPATFIGDSMLLSAAEPIGEIFPQANLDGAIGRQLYDSIAVAENLKANQKIHEPVILILGTNGPFTEEQAKKLIKTIGDEHQVAVVNTSVPRSWEGEVNAIWQKVADENDHVTLIDWYSFASGHGEWLEPDGVHTNPDGSRQFAIFIAESLYEAYGKDKDTQEVHEEAVQQAEEQVLKGDR